MTRSGTRLAAALASLFLLVGAPAASAQTLGDTVGGLGQGLGDTVDQVGGGVGKTVDGVQQQLPQLPQPIQDPVDDTVQTLRDTLEDTTGQDPLEPVVPDDPPSDEPDSGSGSGSGSGSAREPATGGGGGAQRGGGSSGQTQPGSRGGGGSDSGSGGGSGGSGGGAAGDGPDTPVSSADDDGGGAGDDSPVDSALRASERADDDGGGVTGAIREVVEVVPGPIKAALAVLGFLVLLLGAGYLLTHRRASRLRRQREKLLDEVGVLQEALLPEVPARLGPVAVSVSYRPAEGPGAGGDFYDVFELAGGKVAVLVGDVSGHGREALTRTTLMRYTLRAYLDAGMDPKPALQLAGRTLDNDLDGEFATVVVSTFDPANGTLTYASAGHPPPIVCGPAHHEPVTASSSPPIGVDSTTGLRQTRVALPAGSYACFFTDGLAEARVDGDKLLGRARLQSMLADMGPEASAAELIARVRRVSDRATDDMAACIIRPEQGVADSLARVEELEVEPADLDGPGRTFLEACGVEPADLDEALAGARSAAIKSGRALIRVRLAGGRPVVDASPVSPESLEASAGAAS